MAALQSVSARPHVSQYRTLCAGGPCRLRDHGYLRVGRVEGLDCDSPLLVVHSCGATDVWACGNHRESRCVPCSWRYRRLLTRIADDGAPHGGYLYLLTLTAPGRAEHRMPSGDWCPCTPQGGVALSEWNPTAAERWGELRAKIKRAVPEFQYLRAVEVQKRGALHLHCIVWSPVPLDRGVLRRWAMTAGFGHELDLAPIVPGSRKHAYYVAKYVTKATDSRDLVPWAADVVDKETGEISRQLVDGRYRTWSASHGWGLTMRQIKAICAEQRARRRAARSGREPITAQCPALSPQSSSSRRSRPQPFR